MVLPGSFCRMSKEMSAANRTDLLSDALHHYCTLKESKLGVCVCVCACVLLHDPSPRRGGGA